jgi:hypothetical protein
MSVEMRVAIGFIREHRWLFISEIFLKNFHYLDFLMAFILAGLGFNVVPVPVLRTQGIHFMLLFELLMIRDLRLNISHVGFDN